MGLCFHIDNGDDVWTINSVRMQFENVRRCGRCRRRHYHSKHTLAFSREIMRLSLHTAFAVRLFVALSPLVSIRLIPLLLAWPGRVCVCVCDGIRLYGKLRALQHTDAKLNYPRLSGWLG